MKSMSEVYDQVERIQRLGASGTGVSYERFVRAASRVSGIIRAEQRKNPFAKGERFQTNAYLVNRGQGLSNG